MNIQFYARLLANAPLRVLLIVIFVLLVGDKVPLPVQTALYTVSILIKDLLLFVLPLAVFIYITTTLTAFRSQAFLFLIVLLCFEFFSNGLSIWYAYFCGASFASAIPALTVSNVSLEQLTPYFTIGPFRPHFWVADKGLFAGLLLGFFNAFGYLGTFEKYVRYTKKGVDFLFSQVFSKTMVFFMLGFLLNLKYSRTLDILFYQYGKMCLLIIVSVFTYLLLLYGIASHFNIRIWKEYLNNMAPAGAIAFSSMSSAATMPFTIQSTAKNLKNPSFASVLIPATTNVQQIGDCIANALLCIIILRSFGSGLPTIMAWIPFSLVFTIMRFTTSAVLGGAIFIMIPIYQKYLGFNDEMCTIMLAMNVILDPFITSANVLANGALCIIFEKCWHAILKYVKSETP